MLRKAISKINYQDRNRTKCPRTTPPFIIQTVPTFMASLYQLHNIIYNVILYIYLARDFDVLSTTSSQLTNNSRIRDPCVLLDSGHLLQDFMEVIKDKCSSRKKRSKCRICRRNTHYYCSSCISKPPLCHPEVNNCANLLHTQ